MPPIFIASEGEDFVVQYTSRRYNSPAAVEALKVDGKTGQVSVAGTTIGNDPLVVTDQAVWYYDASSGTPSSSGSKTDPVSSMGTIYQRTLGSKSVSAATIFGAANLSDSEAAILGKIRDNSLRTWRYVSAQLPLPPSLHYASRNFDGQNNATLTTGHRLGPTVFNMGSRGTAGNMLQPTTNLQPFFESGTGPGGVPVIHCTDATQQMSAVLSLAPNFFVVALVQWNAATGAHALMDGLDTSHQNAIYHDNQNDEIFLYSGVGGHLSTIQLGDFNKVVARLAATHSAGVVNGVESDNEFNIGSQFASTGIQLFQSANGMWPASDMRLVDYMLFENIHQSNSDFGGFDDYFYYWYGV